MTVTSDQNLFQSVIKMIDSLSTTGNYDTIIHILSLLCLFSVLNQAPAQATPLISTNNQASGNPLQKLLGDLMKPPDGNNSNNSNPLGGALGAALSSPDLLSSLLPLLNNPQIKSKINPANIASVMGMLNNLGGMGGLGGLGALGGLATNPTQEKVEVKPKAEKKTPETESSISNSSEQKSSSSETPIPEKNIEEKTPLTPNIEKKSASRFLNWKTNF